MNFLFKKYALLFFLLIFNLTLFFTGFTGATELKKPLIVASTTQIADFARQVAGDQALVKSILAPGADPHTYNVTPDDVQIVLGADLCIENGLHLEGKNWMSTLAKDAQKPLITATNGIQALSISQGGQSIPDPHAWFSPKNVAVYVNNITRGIIALDPGNKALYRARAKLFLQQLRVLDAWIREQINVISPQQRILVTTHDAFNYFCREYRLNEQNDFLSIAPVGWSTGAEVGAGITPKRRRKVIESIKASGAPAIFVETTINPKQIREIAKETGVKIGGALYSDSMGPKGSAAETYIGMMRENTLLIVNSLK
ncbi:metal ABC transporter solute-binding protein, Zn/Mn family [Desulfobacter sp.]